MNNAAVIYTIKEDLAAKAREYMKEFDISITELAKRVGFSYTALQLYMTGKYTSSPANIEKALSSFLNAGRQVEIGDAGTGLKNNIRPAYYESQDYNDIMAVCQSCQEEQKLGMIIGNSGFGKSYILKRYAKLDKVCYIEGRDRMTYKDMVKAIEKGLGLPRGHGEMGDRIDAIIDFLEVNEGYVIIVDEADKLINKDTQAKLELLRYIYDSGEEENDWKVGIVIAGEPKLKYLIKTYLPRFAKRIDCFAELQGLTGKDVKEYLSRYSITQDAMNEIIVRATNEHTGCFRLLDRTMRNVEKFVKPGEVITLEIIKKASSMMML